MTPQAAPRRADPPASPAAERALIGAALLDWPTLAAEGVLGAVSASDFASPAHSLIWDAIVAVGGSHAAVGVITVTHMLALRGELDRVDALLAPQATEPYLVGCWADSWAANGSSAWARMIRDYADRRRAIARGQRIVREAYEGRGAAGRGGVEL